MLMSTEVERGGGATNNPEVFSCSVCPSAGVTMLMKWETYCSKLFVYDKKYAHKIHSLNQGPLPPSVYLIHRIKYLRYFPFLLIKLDSWRAWE